MPDVHLLYCYMHTGLVDVQASVDIQDSTQHSGFPLLGHLVRKSGS